MAVFAMICRGLLSPFVTDLGLDVTAFTIGTLACTIIIVASCRNSIAIVRNTPNLMAASMPTLRAIIHTLVLIVLLTVVASMFRWTLFGQYFVDSSVIILTGICTAVTCGWLWISIFLCGDMQSSGFGSLILALRILYHNKLTTALLILISSLLTICGVVSCGILLLVTQPITQMMLATAYLMMTNQKIADPRHPIEAA